MILALLLAACPDPSWMADPPARFAALNTPPVATHDGARAVTCWTVERYQGVAVSCLPDSALIARVEP